MTCHLRVSPAISSAIPRSVTLGMGAIVLSTFASLSSAQATAGSPVTSSPPTKPNILLILADDLGYSDLSAFGSEIATPNIDALALQGRMMTNFHTAAVCSPTRASLMTGVDHHLAGMGNMGEVVGVNITRNNPTSAPWGDSNTYDFDNIPEGYRGHLSEKTITLPELLSKQGYHTYMVGKWHLAFDVKRPDKQHKTFYRVKKEALPYARGFEKSFSLLQGGGSHFAPSDVPTPLDMVTYADDGNLLPASALPKDFFSTRFYTDKLIDYIDSNASSGKPFFAYAAYTAPHWPLQAPQKDIEMQKGKYDEGYQVIKYRRFERMKELGIIPANAPMPEQSNVQQNWSALSDEERRVEARKMEIFAAMVTNLDHHVGRLVTHLKEIGEYDNTMILFMSDNGAEGAGAYVPKIPGTKIDNSFENLGKPSSVVAYGPQWAQVSTTAFRYFKGFTGAEGGTSSPLIVKMPGQQESRPISDARTHVMDLFPTLADIASAPIVPDEYQAKQAYQPTGVSFANQLMNQEAFHQVHPDGAVFADELMGASFVMKDNWKLTQQNPPAQQGSFTRDVPFRLYDLSKNRAESEDLSSKHPNIVEDLKKEFANYIRANKVVEHAMSYTGR